MLRPERDLVDLAGAELGQRLVHDPDVRRKLETGQPLLLDFLRHRVGREAPAIGAALCHGRSESGQSAVDVANQVAEFFAGAETSLELALYDIRLHDEAERPQMADAPSLGLSGARQQNLGRLDNWGWEAV